MASAPIILVPGFWLGAWAWDEVVAALRADGHQDVTAITLPGQASKDDADALREEGIEFSPLPPFLTRDHH